jgi:hypothetical protein
VLIWGIELPEDDLLVNEWYNQKHYAMEEDFPGCAFDISIPDIRFYPKELYYPQMCEFIPVMVYT